MWLYHYSKHATLLASALLPAVLAEAEAAAAAAALALRRQWATCAKNGARYLEACSEVPNLNFIYSSTPFTATYS
jgi:hypothetical protein